MKCEIRSYCDDDKASVVGVWERVFPDDPSWNAPDLVIERKMTVQPEAFFVALLNGELVGTVLAGFDGARGWIHHLGVVPEARRAGVATALVAKAEKALDEMGCPKLNLQVRAGNEPAVRFYESLGFQVEDRVSFGKPLGRWAGDAVSR